jgi:hypothetical protein
MIEKINERMVAHGAVRDNLLKHSTIDYFNQIILDYEFQVQVPAVGA